MLDNMEVDPAITIKQQFPKMFTGLGTLHGDYEIRIKPDAKPFSLSTARNIPLPLRDKNLMTWKLKGLSQGYNNLHPGALPWW